MKSFLRWLAGPSRADVLMDELRAAVEKSEVGIELWLSSDTWREDDSEGQAFTEFFARALERNR